MIETELLLKPSGQIMLKLRQLAGIAEVLYETLLEYYQVISSLLRDKGFRKYLEQLIMQLSTCRSHQSYTLGFDGSVDSNIWGLRSKRLCQLSLQNLLVSSPSPKGRGGRPHHCDSAHRQGFPIATWSRSIQLASCLVACPNASLLAAAAAAAGGRADRPWGWQIPVCYWLWRSQIRENVRQWEILIRSISER
jgi:hypothetical protein